MLSRGAASLIACLGLAVLAVAVAGCGGGAGSNGSAELTKELPPDADGYEVIDVAAFKEDLDLDEEADPLAENDLLSAALRPALEALGGSDIPIEEALELGDASAIARSEGREGTVTMIATTADTGEIGSRLGDLGYEERGGLLVAPGVNVGPSFRLRVGVVFVSGSEAALREIPAEAEDDLPDPLLDELDAPWVKVTREPEFDGQCVRSKGGATDIDGEGVIVIRTDGDADADRVRTGPFPGVEVGDPDVSGDTATVEVAPDDPDGSVIGSTAIDAYDFNVVGYSC